MDPIEFANRLNKHYVSVGIGLRECVLASPSPMRYNFRS